MNSYLKRIALQPHGAVGLILLLVLFFTVTIGPVVAPYDPEKFHYSSRLAAPSLEFWFGTDHFGRDILSRILWGSRSTVLIKLTSNHYRNLCGLYSWCLLRIYRGENR